jgi:hypothetical protein
MGKKFSREKLKDPITLIPCFIEIWAKALSNTPTIIKGIYLFIRGLHSFKIG